MAHKLADETLATILAQSLAVSDADFACTTASKSPFASDALSSSTILLVCKRWMRVATPLLYETVVLRSIPQATALASALKANRDFGRYIKKVRVEGGVGASICSVFKAAPNITDLAVTLDLFATDNVSHMYKSLLEAVAPRRLVLCSSLYRLNNNKVTTLALETLCKCIVEWPKLRVVALSEVLVVECSRIYQAICRAAQLEMIHIPQPETQTYHSEFLSELAENCLAPVVRVGWPAQGIDIFGMLEDRLADLSPRAKEKVQFADPKLEKPDVLPINPSFIPLANTSQATRFKIWTRILEIVMHTNGIDKDKLHADWWHNDTVETRLPRGPVLQCMLVCKKWKEIATPLACRKVALTNWRRFESFERFLSANREACFPDLVRSLKVCGDILINIYDIGRIEATIHSGEYLTRFHNLEEFDSGRASVSPKVLKALTSTAGPRLRKLVLRSADPGTYTLPSLPCLSHLHWEIDDPQITLAFSKSHPSFSALEALDLTGYASGLLLRSFAQCSMPAIRVLEFDVDCDEKDVQAFCSVHGAQLRRVTNTGYLDMLRTILRYCPNVTTLDISWASMPPTCMGPALLGAPHTALEELIIPPLECLQGSGAPADDEPEIALLHGFLEQVLPERFPALRKVQIRQHNLWPATQRKIAKHPMPPLAEMMLARGIRLVDEDGVGWKPRLTTTRKKQSISAE